MRESAKETLDMRQRVLLIVLVFVAATLLVVDAPLAMRVAIGLMMAFQLAFVGTKLVVASAAARHRFREFTFEDEGLPRYTTLHPLYKEANMIPLIIEAMEALNYPKDRLQCLLVVEERDPDTVAAVRLAESKGMLPDYFEMVVVPAVKPYGKPKACNYALTKATGDFVVIFDAEDHPEPNQLRKAVHAFRTGSRNLGCVQAPLRFHNQVTTWVSRFMGNEYSLHFNILLRGMAKLDMIIPLGGTSNHFPMRVLHDVQISHEVLPDALGVPAWDPFNVTEDADLGGWLRFFGYSTEMLDSYTDEEAPLTVKAAFNQRTRWVKGYAQTAMVLLRHPADQIRRVGILRYVGFQLTVGGTFLSLLMAPIFWGLTAMWFMFQPHFIVELFPLPLFYAGMVLMLAGNLFLLYMSLVAALQSGIYSTVKYLLLPPFWWMMLSAASYTSLLELIFPNWRPTWNKTTHGVVFVPVWQRVLARVRA